jgi:uncharacterized membrane protein YhaH (DUF805 family)
MINYYIEAFTKNYVNFSGRARRSEYWYFVLFNLLAYLVLFGISYAALGENGIFVVVLYALAVILPSLSLVVRRLHDAGKSGWFYFIALIPIIGGIWLLVLLCTDSEAGTNKWGPNPKGIGNDNIDINSIGANL